MDNKVYKITVLFLFLEIILPFTLGAFLPCECMEDRVLSLNNPPMTGEDVTLLQERLIFLGFLRGKINGVFDVTVAKAVAEFQAAYQLEPDGVVDAATWECLGEDIISVTNPKNTKIPEGELSIIVNILNRTLTLLVDEKAYKTYPVAVGKPTTKSPVGEWAIINKSIHWGGGFGTRWMGLNVPWGVYGIHGTNKPWMIGRAVSAGCIRMHNLHVEELYDWIPLKTRVKIIGTRLPIKVNQILKPGQTGLEVMQLQDNLEKFGFKPGYKDARYGPSTERAVRELEAKYGLKIDGIADWNVLYLLELPGES